MFGEALSGGLTFLRARAEERMRDECVVEFTDGTRDENDDLVYATRFTTKCRIKDMGYADSGSEAGGRRVVSGSTQVHMPWDVEQVYQDDRIRITAIGPTTAARHLGKRWIVGTDQDMSDNTATRLSVKEAP